MSAKSALPIFGTSNHQKISAWQNGSQCPWFKSSSSPPNRSSSFSLCFSTPPQCGKGLCCIAVQFVRFVVPYLLSSTWCCKTDGKKNGDVIRKRSEQLEHIYCLVVICLVVGLFLVCQPVERVVSSVLTIGAPQTTTNSTNNYHWPAAGNSVSIDLLRIKSP